MVVQWSHMTTMCRIVIKVPEENFEIFYVIPLRSELLSDHWLYIYATNKNVAKFSTLAIIGQFSKG